MINAESWLVSFAEYGRNLTRPSESTKPYLAMPSAYFFTHSRRWRSTCSYCFCVLLHEMSTPRRCWQCCMGYENLEAAQKIRRLAVGAEEDDVVSIFPDLPRFEHLVREIVQAPLQALPAALMARASIQKPYRCIRD